MRIQEIAKRLNITPRAIRLYEKKGLLAPERTADNGYRRYSEADAWRLQTIASLRGLGLGLEQIEALLSRYEQGSFQEAHHGLELMRMEMVARWIELQYAIRSVDEWITRSERKNALDLQDLFELADELRQVRQASTWEDRWEFDRLASRYDHAAQTHAIGPLVSAELYEQTLDFMTEWIAPASGEQGLDIGTGTGNLAARLHGAARNVTMCAIDQSREMLSRCRAKFPQLRTKLGNAMSLPYVDEQFHYVASAFALHHLEPAQQLLALEEMTRVVRPNGRICIAGLMTDGSGEAEASGRASASGAPGPYKYPTDRTMLLQWFRDRRYITVQHRMRDSIHIVIAVRR
jgi:putative AdoMet-dependent methyltransferase